MKKCVLVGSGDRAWAMFARPIKERFADRVEVVGIFDVNPLRAERVKSGAGLTCGVYTDFDRMLRETRPDFAAITTVDRFHHEYIIRSLEAGLDAITEKSWRSPCPRRPADMAAPTSASSGCCSRRVCPTR